MGWVSGWIFTENPQLCEGLVNGELIGDASKANLRPLTISLAAKGTLPVGCALMQR
jgi:hypothetical protein